MAVKVEMSGPQKAALLLLHLGKDKAAKVLKTMSETEVEEITSEVARLQKVESTDLDDVLHEFRELAAARMYVARGGLDFAREMLESTLGGTKAREIVERLRVAT